MRLSGRRWNDGKNGRGHPERSRISNMPPPASVSGLGRADTNRALACKFRVLRYHLHMALKDTIMPKAHIHNGALTIPLTDEIRRKLDVHEGEELDAHVFKDSVTFTRTTPEVRRQAGERLLEIISRVRIRPGQPDLSSEEVEQMIDEEVKAVRRARGSRHQHE
jgi:hypothetical protein